MRLFRVLAIGLLLALSAIGVAFWYVAQHQGELVQLILSQIDQRTGVHIEASGSRLALGTRVVVLLDHPRVIIDHREAARLELVRAVFSYSALVHRRGLPLYALVLYHGSLDVMSNVASGAGHAVKTVPSRLDLLARYLEALSAVSRRFELVDIDLLDPEHRTVAQNVNAVAYRTHYRRGRWPWTVHFNAEASLRSIAGARFAGEMRLGRGDNQPNTIAVGRLWFWELPVHNVRLGDFSTSARLLGDVRLVVSPGAQITGKFNCEARDLIVRSPALTSPLALGQYTSYGGYRLSQARADLKHFVVRHESSTVLEANATVLQPYEPSRTVTFSAGGLVVELPGAANWLHRWRAAPASAVHLAERLRSGTLTVSRAALKVPERPARLNLATLRRHLQVNALLTHLSYVAPPEGVPPVYEFNAQVTYSDQVARIRQGTGQIGGSSISDISLDVDLQNANQWPYRLNLSTWLDISDIYRIGHGILEQAAPQIRGKVQWVHGHAPIELHAKGSITDFQPELPHDYLLKADLGDVQFQMLGLPAVASLSSGAIELSPERAVIDKVVVQPLTESGNAFLDGAISFDAGRPKFDDFEVELHQVESEKWLPIFVKPDQLSVEGAIGGKLLANSRLGRVVPVVTGKLTLGNGTVQLGFLRNPIIVPNAATLTLDGKGLMLDLPAARLEGEPLDFRMAVADLDHPELRIDANVNRLDFEVMRFIRAPWSTATPPNFFPVPVAGHIAANSGNFEKLAMTSISTDFRHDSHTWRVYNFRAEAFRGLVALSISGRQRDDWINVKGTILGMDAGPLFLLAEQKREAPIVATLTAKVDLWANTDLDFFRTLAGTLSLTMTNGTINRFTLLTRILSLINLKNWLTAQMPDPRKSGVPFNTLNADFRGVKGVFHTENFRLDGPVMDIVARGDLDLGNSTMNMEIDMLAFQTVNWLMSTIPIIGKNLAGGTKHLVGAYFQVTGPIDSPAIWPKPLTSVAAFVFRAVTLPFSIIAPDAFQ